MLQKAMLILHISHIIDYF